MARTTRPLTNTEIKQSKPRKKEYNLSDGAGLALRIKPNGSKYWIFNFTRPISKKRANISFGAYPVKTPKPNLNPAARQKTSKFLLFFGSVGNDPGSEMGQLADLQTYESTGQNC